MSLQLRDIRPSDDAAIRGLVEAVLEEYRLRADPVDTDADLQDIKGNYLDRGGAFRVLVDETATVVGCGGLYPLGDGEAEIRKMYFLPGARGKGFGRRLLLELLREAKARGYRRVVLETASQLKEAIALYRSAGFQPYQREHLACRCDQAFALELTE
jgi:ribosomal protein S18 acetylase RimI-like enzyme